MRTLHSKSTGKAWHKPTLTQLDAQALRKGIIQAVAPKTFGQLGLNNLNHEAA